MEWLTSVPGNLDLNDARRLASTAIFSLAGRRVPALFVYKWPFPPPPPLDALAKEVEEKARDNHIFFSLSFLRI